MLVGTCRSCSASDVELHKHHIVPKTRGGSDEVFNIVLLCLGCHGKVHDVEFKSSSGVVKNGVSKAKLRQLESKEVITDVFLDNLLSAALSEDEDLWGFLVSGFNLGVISRVHIFDIFIPDPDKRRPLTFNLTVDVKSKILSLPFDPW